MSAPRAPRRTPLEKFEDYFVDQPVVRQAQLLDDLKRLHRIKQRQFTEGLLRAAGDLAEHDAGGMDFEGATE